VIGLQGYVFSPFVAFSVCICFVWLLLPPESAAFFFFRCCFHSLAACWIMTDISLCHQRAEKMTTQVTIEVVDHNTGSTTSGKRKRERKPRDAQYRNFMVTIQKPSTEDWARIENEPAVYKCHASEIGSKTGNYHVHAFFAYDQPRTKNCIMNRFPGGHVDIWGNDCETAKKYLQGPWDGIDKDTGEPKHKDFNPNFKEFGEMKKQGERTDLVDTVQLIRDGATLMDIRGKSFLSFPVTMCERADDEQRKRKQRRIACQERAAAGFVPEVHVRWGRGGTGKTRFVYDNHKVEDIFRAHNDEYMPTFAEMKEQDEEEGIRRSLRNWLSWYSGEPIMLLDDFNGQIPILKLLAFIDRHNAPRKLQKTGRTPVCPRMIYITSYTQPEDWYPGATRHQIQMLQERITSTTCCG
jgi:hypothetical protein